MTQEGALFIVDGYAKLLFQFIYCKHEVLIAVLSNQISLSYDEHWHNLGGADVVWGASTLLTSINGTRYLSDVTHVSSKVSSLYRGIPCSYC